MSLYTPQAFQHIAGKAAFQEKAAHAMVENVEIARYRSFVLIYSIGEWMLIVMEKVSVTHDRMVQALGRLRAI